MTNETQGAQHLRKSNYEVKNAKLPVASGAKIRLIFGQNPDSAPVQFQRSPRLT
jgi:hypothetical protein